MTVEYEEAVRATLYTYLTLGDVLQFASSEAEKAVRSQGALNINTAIFSELQELPMISVSVNEIAMVVNPNNPSLIMCPVNKLTYNVVLENYVRMTKNNKLVCPAILYRPIQGVAMIGI